MNVGTIKKLLIVEDSMEDRQLMEMTLSSSAGKREITYATDGDEALRILFGSKGAGPSDPVWLPDIVLLDLNLPLVSGREVLKEIRVRDSMNFVPVVVFTTSQSKEDLSFCASHGASAYVRKPMDLDEFSRAIRLIDEFWLGLAENLKPEKYFL